MRFYAPENDDNVDGNYDFINDELSTIGTDGREQHFIWDIFDYPETPIDGVLISRDKVKDRPSKEESLTTYGVYSEESVLDIPDWLPTISDCGAWTFKSLPFPPYDNKEMLDFYESLDVSVGVTLDHPVLGSGKQGRLYLDERAFSAEFSEEDIPDRLGKKYDIMVTDWSDPVHGWPNYVEEYEPSIYHISCPLPFDASLFEGAAEDIVARLEDDPRAVFQENDTDFRYELTLENAEKMYALHLDGDYSFRLMAAIQGNSPESYAEATERVLDMGYRYIGIGGLASSQVDEVRGIVNAVGDTIREFENEHSTRVDAHVFGFAKTDAFSDIGQSRMSSFDSASMLRSAWNSGNNYHMDSDTKYDAVRVRQPTSVKAALWGQEMLYALRAYDEQTSIADAILEWEEVAETAITQFEEYVKNNRFNGGHDSKRVTDVRQHLRDNFEYTAELKASFGDEFWKDITWKLCDDTPDNGVELDEYLEMIDEAKAVFESEFPKMQSAIREHEEKTGEVGSFEQIWSVVTEYAKSDVIDDADLLSGYKETLRERPWEQCDCAICTERGIEVVIWRGNNRNRRRGFHNTKRFYEEFQDALPKTLALVPADSGISGFDSVETYLKENHGRFWNEVNDAPVAEVGTFTEEGVHEWWDDTPSTVSFEAGKMETVLSRHCARYQDVYLFDPSDTVSDRLVDAIKEVDCQVHTYDDPAQLREELDSELGLRTNYSLTDSFA